jgi:PAS domain S-box-containing protein
LKNADDPQQLIEQLKAANAALQASEAKYRIVADNTYDWEYWLSPEGQFVYISPSCERMTGYHQAEFESDPGLLWRIIHPEDRARWDAHHTQPTAAASPTELEFRIVHRDGGEHWVGHCCQPIFDAAGKFLGRRGSNRDITDRQLLSDALRLSERRFRALTENAAEMITILDADGRITYESPAVERVLGYPMNHLIGRNIFELVHPADRERAMQSFEGSLSKPGVTFRDELRLVSSDGRWRTVEFVGRNLFHEPAVQGIVINSRDITERTPSPDRPPAV